VCAGTEAQVQAVIDAGLIPHLAHLLETAEAVVMKVVFVPRFCVRMHYMQLCFF